MQFLEGILQVRGGERRAFFWPGFGQTRGWRGGKGSADSFARSGQYVENRKAIHRMRPGGVTGAEDAAICPPPLQELIRRKSIQQWVETAVRAALCG